MIEGGCLCGSIRYRADCIPVLEAVCHCRNCQRQGGAPFSVLVGVKAEALVIKGAPKVYIDRGESGNEVLRYFCGHCGSPIYSALPASPEIVYLKAGALDDPSALDPTLHLWCASAWPSTLIPAGATRIDRNPT